MSPLAKEILFTGYSSLDRRCLAGYYPSFNLDSQISSHPERQKERNELASYATICLVAYLDIAMSLARFPSYVTKASIGLGHIGYLAGF